MNAKEVMQKKNEIFKRVQDDANLMRLYLREDCSTLRARGFRVKQKTLLEIDIREQTLDKTIEILESFKKEADEIGKNTPATMIHGVEKAETEDEDAYVSEFGFKLVQLLITDEEVERVQKLEFRNWLGSVLDCNNRVPSCEIIELFLNKTIDWEAMRNITIKNCEI